MFEVIYAMVLNLGWLAVVLMRGSIIALLITTVCIFDIKSKIARYKASKWGTEEHEHDLATTKYILHLAIAVFFISLPIAIIPAPSTLFELRLNMLKYQLASPENVSAGIEHVKVIAKELECRYLQHCEEAKEDKKWALKKL